MDGLRCLMRSFGHLLMCGEAVKDVSMRKKATILFGPDCSVQRSLRKFDNPGMCSATLKLGTNSREQWQDLILASPILRKAFGMQ
jgi:hypothetical protein